MIGLSLRFINGKIDKAAEKLDRDKVDKKLCDLHVKDVEEIKTAVKAIPELATNMAVISTEMRNLTNEVKKYNGDH